MIDVVGIGKRYRQYPGLRHRLLDWMGFTPASLIDQWVLRNITFRVAPGESVGIVGANGAGKSTLLKLITGILLPNAGSVLVHGRVSAILELGMGFNHDITGRHNVYLAAGLLGYHRHEIDLMVDGIRGFSELGEYFDAPLRTYSTGMQMRLAFSIATARRPDVLLIDEALSVGDAYFQHKSFSRIREYRESGTTLLFVSHDRSAVQALCDRVILLERGTLIKDGHPEEVMNVYNALIAERETHTLQILTTPEGKDAALSGTGQAKVEDIGLYDAEGQKVEVVNVGDSVELRLRARLYADIPRLVMGYMIKDRLGQTIFGTNTHHTNQALEQVADGSDIIFRITFTANMGPGSYSVSTALVSHDTHLVNNYEWRDLALLFHVANMDKTLFIGDSWMPPVIGIE